MIHVSGDQVAIGSGPSRQVMTLNELQKQLVVIADAGLKTGSKCAVILVSDTDVSGEFGLVILKTIIDSDILLG